MKIESTNVRNKPSAKRLNHGGDGNLPFDFPAVLEVKRTEAAHIVDLTFLRNVPNVAIRLEKDCLKIFIQTNGTYEKVYDSKEST
jgi:hypothetical protein